MRKAGATAPNAAQEGILGHVSDEQLRLPVRAELVSLHDGAGDHPFRIGWFEDTTDERRAEQAREHALRDFEIAFHNAPIGVAIVGLDGRFIRVNQRLCEITGYPEHELEALTFQEITYPDDLELDLAHVEELLAGERSSYEMEKRYFTKQGHLIWILLSAALVRDDDGEPLHFISQIQDVSKRKRMEAHLSELAHRDPVTSLWNRRRFEEELERQISRCHRYGEQAALILLDLDGFKAVNDRNGHKAGDRLLRSIGRQLDERTRASDLVARIGGDEFAVLALNVSAAQGTALGEDLREGIRRHHADSGVTASVGVVHLDARAPSAGVCFGAADAAMYDAKGDGGDRVARRTAEPEEQARA